MKGWNVPPYLYPAHLGSEFSMEAPRPSLAIENLWKRYDGKPAVEGLSLAVRPGEDNRMHRVEVTATGTQLLRDASPLWHKAQAEATRRLGKEGLAALHTLTQKLGGCGRVL